MRQQLIEKLGAAVAADIASECQVVYILAEARKLLEKYPPDPTPFALKMYCHWALHVDLTNPGTTERFLGQIDNFVESVIAGGKDINLEHRVFHEFAYWETFRTQFREFLRAYGLQTAICDEEKRWHEFLRYYARVIEDGSLCCQSKTQRLKYVRKVVFEKRTPRSAPNLAPFDLAAHIVLIDGRALTVDVSACPLPDGSPMLAFGIKFHWQGKDGFFSPQKRDQ